MDRSVNQIISLLIILTIPFLGGSQSVFNKAYDESNTANHTSNALEYADHYYFTQKVFIGGAAVLEAVCLESTGLVVKKKVVVTDSIKNIFYGYAGSFQRLSSNEFCQLYKTGGDSTLKLVFFDDSLDVIRTVVYGLNLYSGSGVIKQANDSTLLILGQVSNPVFWDLVLINTDLQGNERWRTILGEPGKDDYGFTIDVIDEEVVVGGQTYFNSQEAHPYIVSLSAFGQVIFDTIYTQFDNGGSFAYHSDYGFFLYSTKNNLPTSLFPVIIKLDANFILEWSKEYFRDAEFVTTGAITISDQGIISMAGSQWGSNNSGVFFQINHQGDSLGSKILEYLPNETAEFVSIRPTSDGGYILAGQTNAPTQDSWIVKVNAWGCDNIPCVVGVDEVAQVTGSLKCYPNPTNGGGTISGRLTRVSATSELKIFNAMGQLVESIAIPQKEFEVPVNFTGKGLYWVVLMQNGAVIQQQKWVVQ